MYDPTMRNNNANSDKSGGSARDEPVTATVELGGETITIDAEHHIINERAQLMHLYVERDGRIDVTVPLARDGAAWAQTDAGREALGIGTEYADGDRVLVTDGGRDFYDVLQRRTADLNALKKAGATCALPSCDNPMDQHDLGLLFCSPACGSKHLDRSGERGQLTEESIGVPVEDICDFFSGGYIGR